MLPLPRPVAPVLGVARVVRGETGRGASVLVAGSHLLLSCLGFSSASYLKVHVKTHHGVPLPQVSRHPEPIPNGGAAFHSVRTYGIKGKRPLPRSWCRTLAGGRGGVQGPFARLRTGQSKGLREQRKAVPRPSRAPTGSGKEGRPRWDSEILLSLRGGGPASLSCWRDAGQLPPFFSSPRARGRSLELCSTGWVLLHGEQLLKHVF